MSILKRVGVCLSAVAALGISEVAIAQELVDLGRTPSGEQAYLQQKTKQSLDFKIVQTYGDGILQSSMRANCGEGKTFLFMADIYNTQGRRIKHLDVNKDSVPPQKSVAALALKAVCRNVGAAGW